MARTPPVSKRPTPRLSAKDKQRFEELAALERIILEQDERIGAMTAQIATLERKLATAAQPAADPSVAGGAKELAEAQAQLETLRTDLANLQQAVTVKERLRFEMEAELRSTILVLDEKETLLEQLQAQPAAPSPDPRLQEELVQLANLLQDQDSVLEARQEELELLRLQLEAADARAAQAEADVQRLAKAAETLAETTEGPTAPTERPVVPTALLTDRRALLTRVIAERDRQAVQAGAQPYFPALTQPEDGYVFVITYGMSGDILLQEILNGIEGYCIRGENGNVLGHLARSWFQAEQALQQQVQDGALPPAQALTAQDVLGWKLANTFVQTVLAPPEDTRTLGFREIRYPRDPDQFRRQLDFMYGCFPGARFLFNTRSKEAVAQSGWWADRDPAEVYRTLEQWDALFAGYLAEYPDRGFAVHHDDYIDSPAALRPMFAFLGQPFREEEVVRLIEQALARETAILSGDAA